MVGWIVGGLTACSTTLNPAEEYYAPGDSLQAVYYQLSDSLNHAWDILRQDDANKNIRLQRLLREMRQSGRYASDTLDSLSGLVAQLAELDYDSVTMGNEHRVHRYDSATVAVSEAVVQYAEARSDYEGRPVLTYLADKILDANRGMALYRLRYDRYSRLFNRFLDDHHTMIATLDSGATPQRRFIFRATGESSNP